jgi:predicted PurR-regulated permease PerM
LLAFSIRQDRDWPSCSGLSCADGQRSEEMLKLAGSTIRNVSRGVVGIALMQSFLAGLGFLAAGVPAAGFLGFIALVLAIIQIRPAILFIPIVVWSWTAMETANALMFTAYMVPVGLVDNILRPLVMGRGLTTPMPVILIGVVGGTLAYGLSGLFLGPVVLSVTWALLAAWAQEDSPGGSETGGAASSTPGQNNLVWTRLRALISSGTTFIATLGPACACSRTVGF